MTMTRRWRLLLMHANSCVRSLFNLLAVEGPWAYDGGQPGWTRVRSRPRTGSIAALELIHAVCSVRKVMTILSRRHQADFREGRQVSEHNIKAVSSASACSAIQSLSTGYRGIGYSIISVCLCLFVLFFYRYEPNCGKMPYLDRNVKQSFNKFQYWDPEADEFRNLVRIKTGSLVFTW